MELAGKYEKQEGNSKGQLPTVTRVTNGTVTAGMTSGKEEENNSIKDADGIRNEESAGNLLNGKGQKHQNNRYFGPYQVKKKVGQVAYTLQLPAGSQVHPTFHVSQLKKHHGKLPSISPETLIAGPSEVLVREPLAVIDKRSIKRHNHAVVQWLIHWSNTEPEEATWEDAQAIEEKFPTFDPWGQGSSEGGGIDISSMELAGKYEKQEGNSKGQLPTVTRVTNGTVTAGMTSGKEEENNSIKDADGIRNEESAGNLLNGKDTCEVIKEPLGMSGPQMIGTEYEM